MIGLLFDVSPFYAGLAGAATTVALWAQGRAHRRPRVGPMDDLTDRLRHPVRWALRHSIRAARRRSHRG